MIPDNLRYTRDHEWIDVREGIGVVGITHYAQEKLGDITYVELPDVGREVQQHDEVCAIESIKAAADIYAPAGGKIVEVNGALDERPELVNEDPYGEGWVYKLDEVNDSDIANMLTPEQYAEHLKQIEEES